MEQITATEVLPAWRDTLSRMRDQGGQHGEREVQQVVDIVEVFERMARLESYGRLTVPQQDQYNDMVREANTLLRAHHDEQESRQRREARDAVARNLGGMRSEAGAFAGGARGGGELPRGPRGVDRGAPRDAALRAIDGRRDVEDRVREFMVRSVEEARGAERDRVSRWITVSSDRDYERALSIYLADPVNGPAEWTDVERQAVRRVKDEARALNLLDTSGGYLVGATTDFSIMLTSAGSVNPMRQVSRIVTTTTDSWGGITSAGISASWDAEAAEVSDDSPAFGNPVIPVYKGSAYAQASWELDSDSGLGTQLGPLFADARDQLEAQAFTLGSGTGAPQGVITGVTAVPGSVVGASSTTHTLADAVTVQNALPARWRANAQWMGNLAVRTAYSQLPAGSGLTSPAYSGGQLLGWGFVENSMMDGTIGAGNDYVLLAGDFRNYTIVDRVGMSVQYIPVVYGANRRPTSEVGWLCRWRTGGAVTIPDAFRLLNLSA